MEAVTSDLVEGAGMPGNGLSGQQNRPLARMAAQGGEREPKVSAKVSAQRGGLRLRERGAKGRSVCVTSLRD